MFQNILQRLVPGRNDLMASFVVFLVALPLCMGIAFACHVPVGAGIIGGAVGGLVVSSLSGAPFMISGPSAAQAVLVFGMVEMFGISAVATAAFLAGVLQVLVSRLRVANWVTAISPAILQGMLAGCGLLIAAAQLTVVLGAAPRKTLIENMQLLPSLLRNASFASLLLGAVAFTILLLWPKLPRVSAIPAPLVTIVAATLLVLALHLQVAKIPLPNEIWTVTWPALPNHDFLAFAFAVVTIMAVATAESLLSALAVDRMHQAERAQLDRELLAQGVGNMVSGLLGGLPIAGVIVRSTANLEAGAVSRKSGIWHGVWMVVAVTFFGAALRNIPLAAVSALLVVAGLKPINFSAIRRLKEQGELPVYLTTLLGVICSNLLTGIALGGVAALICLAWRTGRGQINITEETDGSYRVALSGVQSFLTVPTLRQALGKIPRGISVSLDQTASHLLDHAAREAICEWQELHEKSGGSITLRS